MTETTAYIVTEHERPSHLGGGTRYAVTHVASGEQMCNSATGFNRFAAHRVAAEEWADVLNGVTDASGSVIPKLTGAQRGALEAYASADERGLPIFGAVDHRLKRMGLIEYVGGHVSHRMHKISERGRVALG